MALVTGVQTDSEIRGLREHYPLITRGRATASSINRALNVSGANTTYTAASLVTAGAIVRDCDGGAKTDTLPSAASIIAAFRLQDGDSVSFLFYADRDQLNLTAGANTTIEGRSFIPADKPGVLRLSVVGSALLGGIFEPTLDAAVRQQFFVLSPNGETAIATAGPVTYTGANVAPGLVLRNPAGADRADELPLTAQSIASLALTFVGANRLVYIASTNANSVTVAPQGADAGTTLVGSGVIAANTGATFLVSRTGASAVRWLRV